MKKKIANRPENQRVLKHLPGKNDTSFEAYLFDEIAEDEIEKVYYGCGSHPEIVVRVWDDLAESFPDSCCCVLNGAPCLVNEESGVILAVCMGTEYALRLDEEDFLKAKEKGCDTVCDWGGTSPPTNLELEFGMNWVFGEFVEEEKDWIQNIYGEFNRA